MSKEKETKFPKHSVHILLHALGITEVPGGGYIQPGNNKNGNPMSYRNFFHVDQDDDWDEHVKEGRAIKKNSNGLLYYVVTPEGKAYLRSLGYKWSLGGAFPTKCTNCGNTGDSWVTCELSGRIKELECFEQELRDDLPFLAFDICGKCGTWHLSNRVSIPETERALGPELEEE